MKNVSTLRFDNNRPLFVDFDKYTDGDNDFKKELALLMIDNIYELIGSLESTQKDLQVFLKTIHKIKPTIEMLDDAELNENIKNVEAEPGQQMMLSSLRNICTDIIHSLQKVIA
jgi:hypothetical protein